VQLRLNLQNGPVLLEDVIVEVLDKELRDDVEVVLVFLEDMLYQGKYSVDALEIELVLVNQVHDLQNLRFQHNFVTPLD
jgi:hypothetical protein